MPRVAYARRGESTDSTDTHLTSPWLELNAMCKYLRGFRIIGLLFLAGHSLGISTFAAKPVPVLQPCQLAGVHDALQQMVAAGEIAGAVTLVDHAGEVVHYDAVGLADVATNRPMQLDAVFQIASMTKPMAAAAVALAAQEGKLSLADPVSKHLPAFKDSPSDPTLTQLLSHTSGLADPDQVPFFNSLSLEEFSNRAAVTPRKFAPGENWAYGTGISVAGRVLEVVDGQPFATALNRRILQPLNMLDTTFTPSDSQRKRIPTMYAPGKEPGTLEPRPTPGLLTDQDEPVTPNPSGGLFSTAADLLQFQRAWRSTGLLAKAGVTEKLRTLQTEKFTTGFSPGNGWGLGICLIREPQGVTEMLHPGTFGHGGAWGTQAWQDPMTDTIYILLVQRVGFPHNSDDSELRRVFQQAVVDGLASR